MRLAPLVIAALLAGCDLLPTGQLVVERPDHDPADGYTLSIALATSRTTAGTDVPYTVTLTDPDGLALPSFDWELDDGLEPTLFWTPTVVRPIVAGDHLLTATVRIDGAPLRTSVTLEVDPDAAYDLDLVLSDHGMLAGEEVAYEVHASDVWGNVLDVGPAVVTADPELTVDSDGITGTIPGTFLVTAALDDLDDVEVLVVAPGPPAAIDLTMPTDLELFQTSSATVVVTDAFGNPTRDAWTITTSRPPDTIVSHRNVTFLAEGWFTVTARVDGTSLTDFVGPFLIDSTGPILTLNTPPRGAWVVGSSTTVIGTAVDDWSEHVDVAVNGTPVTTSADGSFTRPITLPFGTSVVETVAVDGDGNRTTDTRAVLAGSFRTYGTWAPDGVVVRINEGSGGTGALEEIGEGLIASADLASAIRNPVVNEISRDYVNPCGWFGGDCGWWVTWYSLYINVTNPSFSGTDLTIDARSDGTIALTMVVEYPHLSWSASGTVVGIGYSASGAVDATNITVTLITKPRVTTNQVYVDIQSVTATALNFDFKVNGLQWLESALSFFGVNIDAIVRDLALDGIEDAVRAEVPGALEDALQDLELGYDFALEGNTYSLDARPYAVGVNSSGITLSMESKVTVDQWVHAGWKGWGSLSRPYTPPTTWTTTPYTNLAMSGDLINQVLYAVWGGGVLDIEEDAAALGLDVAQIEPILPGVDSLVITVRPLLPPVVIPGSGTAEYQLQMGDLEITLYNGDPADDLILIQAYTTAFADLDVSSVGDLRLKATVGAPRLHFDVVVPESNSLAAADTEALLQAIVPLLMPRLTDAIGEIDLPSIQGFGISGITVRTGGSYNGFAILGGNLYAE